MKNNGSNFQFHQRTAVSLALFWDIRTNPEMTSITDYSSKCEKLAFILNDLARNA